MISGNAIRGSMIGAGPMGEPERGEAAPRIRVSFWCANKHETQPTFAAGAAIPETWECPRCGHPAGRDEHNPPARLRAGPYKTHLAYVKERRSDSDGAAILAEALARLRGAASARPPAPTPQLPAGGADMRELASAPSPLADARECRRGAQEARGPGRIGGDPDLAKADVPAPARARREPAISAESARAGASTRKPARTRRGRTDPVPPPDLVAEERCDDCGYKVTAPGHKLTCLGQ